jgi:hypothetical protein
MATAHAVVAGFEKIKATRQIRIEKYASFEVALQLYFLEGFPTMPRTEGLQNFPIPYIRPRVNND